MATHKKTKSPGKGANKSFAAKRSMNPGFSGGRQGNTGKAKAFQELDIRRRKGSFETRGAHARSGSRGHQ
jgi:hypothetical protein